jgi:hypothetical protein
MGRGLLIFCGMNFMPQNKKVLTHQDVTKAEALENKNAARAWGESRRCAIRIEGSPHG